MKTLHIAVLTAILCSLNSCLSSVLQLSRYYINDVDISRLSSHYIDDDEVTKGEHESYDWFKFSLGHHASYDQAVRDALKDYPGAIGLSEAYFTRETNYICALSYDRVRVTGKPIYENAKQARRPRKQPQP